MLSASFLSERVIVTFDSFGGMSDEKIFDEVCSKLYLLKENIDQYLENCKQNIFTDEVDNYIKKKRINQLSSSRFKYELSLIYDISSIISSMISSNKI